MANQSFKDNGAEFLIAIKNDVEILQLDYSGNYFRQQDLPKIKEFLMSIRNLQILNLSNCNLQSDGGLYVSIGIQNNFHLKSLDISINKFGDAIGGTICLSLINCPTMEEVNLAENGLSYQTMENLIQLIQKNDRIKKMDFRKNYIQNKDVQSLFELLQNNSYSIELDLTENILNSIN